MANYYLLVTLLVGFGAQLFLPCRKNGGRTETEIIPNSFKLFYFNITGRAEVTRMLFNYGGLTFDDIRVPVDQWPNIKEEMPFGQLPVLEIDEGKLIPQSLAIARYVAKLVKLNGKNYQEDLLIDSAVDSLCDMNTRINAYTFEKEEENRKALEDILFNKTLPYFLGKFDEQAKINGGYLAVDRLTWADVLFVSLLENHLNGLKRDVYSDYSNLMKVKANVLAVPTIRDWIRDRPIMEMATYDLRNDL